jgi:hypothetical protein
MDKIIFEGDGFVLRQHEDMFSLSFPKSEPIPFCGQLTSLELTTGYHGEEEYLIALEHLTPSPLTKLGVIPQGAVCLHHPGRVLVRALKDTPGRRVIAHLPLGEGLPLNGAQPIEGLRLLPEINLPYWANIPRSHGGRMLPQACIRLTGVFIGDTDEVFIYATNAVADAIPEVKF